MEIEGLDTARGIAMTGGTIAAYRKVLSSFYKDAVERLDIFARSPAEGKLYDFTASAHAIKSACATIGAAEVSAMAAELETAGKAGDIAAITEKIPAFYRALAETVENIRKALEAEKTEKDSAETGGKPGTKNGGFNALLTGLKAALESKNMKEIDRIMAELEGLSLDTETAETLTSISDHILMSEFTEAAAAIEGLTGRKDQ